MNYRLRGWLVLASVILFCAGALWMLQSYRSRRVESREAMLSRLPTKDAVIVGIDFAALRQGGLMDLLARSKTPEEQEYKDFVGETDFDYKQDLDLALASFGPDGGHYLLRGRFDWKKLSAYARSQHGDCNYTFCKMSGSTPDRKISFFPVQSRLMALAVSSNPDAAYRLLHQTQLDRHLPLPADPLWISFPGSVMRQPDKLPAGTRMFAKSIEDAQEVTLSIGPQGEDFRALLNVQCKTERDADLLVAELNRSTELLRSLIEREHRTPNPRDLSGVLTAGKFHREAQRVAGEWPIAHGFVEDALTGGI